MCETKKRIGDILHDLMLGRAVEHITVHDIMDRTKMKRQSFYYHFQDIYDVLEWELDQRLYSQIKYDPAVSFDDWVTHAADIIMSDRTFYCRALEAQGREKAMAAALPTARSYVSRILLGGDVPEARITDNEKFMINFMSEAVINYAIDQLSFQRKLTDGQIRTQARTVMNNVARYYGMHIKPVYVYPGEKEAKKLAVGF